MLFLMVESFSNGGGQFRKIFENLFFLKEMSYKTSILRSLEAQTIGKCYFWWYLSLRCTGDDFGKFVFFEKMSYETSILRSWRPRSLENVIFDGRKIFQRRFQNRIFPNRVHKKNIFRKMSKKLHKISGVTPPPLCSTKFGSVPGVTPPPLCSN